LRFYRQGEIVNNIGEDWWGEGKKLLLKQLRIDHIVYLIGWG